MKKTLLTSFAVLVLIGTVSLATFAFGPGMGQGLNQARAFRFSGDLNLTPEQEQKILAIRQDFLNETQSLRFELQRKQLELRQLWAAQSLNRSAIEAKEKEIIGLRIQIVNKARVMQEKMKSILTADQYKKLEESGLNRSPGVKGRGPRGVGRMRGSF